MKHLVELGAQLTGAVLLHESIGAVANHGQQPGTRVVTVESVEEAECAHNGLLSDILGILVVAQEPTSEVVACPHVGQHHCLERLDSMRQHSSERPGPPPATAVRLPLFRTDAFPRFSAWIGVQSGVARRRSSCSSFTRRMPE